MLKYCEESVEEKVSSPESPSGGAARGGPRVSYLLGCFEVVKHDRPRGTEPASPVRGPETLPFCLSVFESTL